MDRAEDCVQFNIHHVLLNHQINQNLMGIISLAVIIDKTQIGGGGDIALNKNTAIYKPKESLINSFHVQIDLNSK